jgi:hypothetical protein
VILGLRGAVTLVKKDYHDRPKKQVAKSDEIDMFERWVTTVGS